MVHTCHQELRIAKLEADSMGQNRDLQNLVNELRELKESLKWLSRTLITTSISLMGFLIWQVFIK